MLFIIVDDYRFDAIDTLGADLVATPHLDRLVDTNCAFTRHHKMGSEVFAIVMAPVSPPD